MSDAAIRVTPGAALASQGQSSFTAASSDPGQGEGPNRTLANVLGVGVDAIDLPTAVARILDACRARRRGYVCVTNVHAIMEVQGDPALRAIYDRADLSVPDGVPTVWVGRAQGHREMSRVYGPDLMLAVCAASPQAGLRHFLYGGVEGVADRLADALRARFADIEIVGTYTPPFRALTADEERDVIGRVAAARPDIMWVGLGCPKQERFMASALDRWPVTLMIGVGAAFDMLSGRTSQAPRWMQRTGLEWLYRLCQEPRRLGGRYLRTNPAFAVLSLLQFLGLRRYGKPAST